MKNYHKHEVRESGNKHPKVDDIRVTAVRLDFFNLIINQVETPLLPPPHKTNPK